MPSVGEDNDPDIANPGSQTDTDPDGAPQDEHMSAQSDILTHTDQSTVTSEPGTVTQLPVGAGHREDDPLSGVVVVDDRLAEDEANGSSPTEGGECLSLETGVDGGLEEGGCLNSGAQDGKGKGVHTEMEVSLETGNVRKVRLSQEEELQRR